MGRGNVAGLEARIRAARQRGHDGRLQARRWTGRLLMAGAIGLAACSPASAYISASTGTTLRYELEGQPGFSLPTGVSVTGAYVTFWSEGIASQWIWLPYFNNEAHVAASGTSCVNPATGGSRPRMKVHLDGKLMIDTLVSTSSWTRYDSNATWTDYSLDRGYFFGSGWHLLKVAFTNDLLRSGVCDRNLFVDYVDIFSFKH